MQSGTSRRISETDVALVETGMFDTTGYGAVYVLDRNPPALVESGIGTDVDAVLSGIRDAGVDPSDVETIALTHVHLDHAGGAGFLLESCPDATVYVHERGRSHLSDPDALIAGTKEAVGDMWRHYTAPPSIPRERLVSLTDGDAVPVGETELVAHRCPGHAPHQVAFADPASGAVFAGDAAGIWVEPRSEVRETTPPPQFDLETALDDVETIRSLAPDRLLFTHFGPVESGVDRTLDRYRERLVGWVEAVRQRRAEESDDAVAEHFATAAERTVGEVWGTDKARAEAKLNVRGAIAHLDARD